jgi:LPXTG-site transpeptidase (sortase) family protein
VNSGLPLSNGNYRLYACGPTSITDLIDPTLQLAGDGTNEGTDFIRNFIVSISNDNGGNGSGPGGGRRFYGLPIPMSGFAPFQTTLLPVQPAAAAYTSEADLRLEIPSLSINMPIVGIPFTDSGWDVQWLARNAGYLDGSAYPTWIGNSVLTAHVTDANGKPGPFFYLNELRNGDKIIIHIYGQQYIYEVQTAELVAPKNISAVFKHENYQWVTLVTCENYNNARRTFLFRRVVRAVLISVLPGN